MGSSRSRTVGLAFLALLVVATFLVRRTGILPERGAEFDPVDYQEAPVVEAEEAHTAVGERAVVCGTVVNVTFATGVGGQPTYLNLERAFPDQPFDAVIWGRHRDRFHPPPETAYRQRRICVAGRVTTHEGVPRIEVSTPEQIRTAPGG